jgi:hypothetical protein
MGRIRRRLGWLILIVVAALASVGAALWLFAEAGCPRLQSSLLYAALVLGWVVVTLYALITKNDSIVSRVVTVSVMFAIPLVVSSVLGPILLGLPGVRDVFCAPPAVCKAAQAEELRLAGQLEGAEYLARQCLEETSDPDCLEACGCELARVRYEQAGILIEARRCGEVEAVLEEACSLADRHGAKDVRIAADERLRNYELACATPTPLPLPSPTPPPSVKIEILRTTRDGSQTSIDFRVLEDGEYVAGLLENQLEVRTVGGAQVPVTAYEERSADDPVCIIAVVDNSGSITPGVEQIRAAIGTLNDRRKPDDELGLVLFAERDRVQVVQGPASTPLDTQTVSGAGQSTALWDGVLMGLDLAQECSVEARYLIVLTDGADNDSVGLAGDNNSCGREIAQRARAQGVSVCTVGVRSETLEQGPLELAAYGCRYSHASDFDVLVSLFQDLFGYVRRFYRVESSLPETEETAVLCVLSEEVVVEFGQ